MGRFISNITASALNFFEQFSKERTIGDFSDILTGLE